MAVGFYLAIAQDSDIDLADDAQIDIVEMQPLALPDSAVDRGVEPIEMRYQPADARMLGVAMRQTTRRNYGEERDKTLVTNIDLKVKEELGEADAARFDREAAVAITRHYEGAQAEVVAGEDKRVGPGITSQVEALIRGSITRTYLTPTGEPIDFEWREVPNPQARRMLYLMRDAHSFLTPRFFQGGVNPGESWSYEMPLSVEQPELGVSADGKVSIENTFEGMVVNDEARLAVIRQKLAAEASGELDSEEAEASFEVSGEGEGLVIFDVDAGRVRAADLQLSRTLDVAGTDQPASFTSEFFLGVRPTDTSALPELGEKEDQDGHKLEASKDHAEAE